MKTAERRLEMLYLLVRRRYVKLSDLQAEFHISRWTAIQDIHELSRSFPIRTEQGRYGGIFLDKDYQLGMKYLTELQANLLEELSSTLTGEDLHLMQEILKTFKKPS